MTTAGQDGGAPGGGGAGPRGVFMTWGGGEMASADGIRFVIPVSTIHAAYNPRYFGRQRGSTLYLLSLTLRTEP